MSAPDAGFTGSIPTIYDRHLGPLLFQPYARDLGARVARLQPARVLETAAGTGIVTAAVAAAVPDAEIVATDLSPAMLEVAAAHVRSAKVRFEPADAQALPFPDAAFDVVVCQFGVMFFPDRVRAYREARRVLRPGGVFLANAWDRLGANPVSLVVGETLAALFPDDPPRFLEWLPFGYHDRAVIERDVREAGFDEVRVETLQLESTVSSAREAAMGLCMGSPLRAEIEERDAGRLDEVVAAATDALERAGFGAGAPSPLSANLITAR